MTSYNEPPFDQALAAFRDGMPRIWWNLYQGLLSTGFQKTQAFSLLTAYILSQNPNGIRPDNQPGPNTDKE